MWHERPFVYYKLGSKPPTLPKITTPKEYRGYWNTRKVKKGPRVSDLSNIIKLENFQDLLNAIKSFRKNPFIILENNSIFRIGVENGKYISKYQIKIQLKKIIFQKTRYDDVLCDVFRISKDMIELALLTGAYNSLCLKYTTSEKIVDTCSINFNNNIIKLDRRVLKPEKKTFQKRILKWL